MIGTTISHYRITAKIGAGGMGEVFRAHDPRLDREVAIKTLSRAAIADPARLARFEREARATGSLNHPNILAIYDVGQHEGVPFIVSELLIGRTLRQRLREGDIAPRKALEYAIQIADGLAAAHSRGIIHRDLKPENVFITEDGVVKILDFGLAKLQQPERESRDLSRLDTPTVQTEEGAIVGTLGYMAPEQLHGRPADHRSDIFAFGSLLYEMLAGARAFSGDSKANVVAAILRDDPPSFASFQRPMPPALEELVRRCLEKRPEDRYQSARDLALALRTIDNTTEWSSASHRPARRRRRLQAAAVAAALVVVAALSLWAWKARRQAVEPAGSSPPKRTAARSLDRPHVAVLPFRASRGESEEVVVGAGLRRVLAEELALVEEQTRGRLWVLPADHRGSMEQVRREFNVNAGIDGAVGLSGGQTTVRLDVLSPADDAILGSTTIEGRLDGALQIELVERAARLLGVAIEATTLAELERRCTAVGRAFEKRVMGLGLLAGDVDPEVFDRAIAALERATHEDPGYAMARVSLAEAMLRRFHATLDRGWLERADAQARVAADQDPPTSEALRVLADVCLADGRAGDAVDALERAVELAPDSAQNRFELGIALREAGRYDEAERALQRAINLRPEYVNGPLELGFLYYITNRYDAAANQYRLAAALAPLNTTAYNNLGGLMYFLDRPQEAREAFEASLAAGPNSVAYSQLGTMAFEDGDYARAADMFERAVELEPDDCMLAGNLATSYHWGGNRDRATPALRRAIEVCEKSLAAGPNDQLAMASLAGYYGVLGEHRERGLELLDQATSSEIVDAQLLAVIGESYEDLGERDSALEWLGKALAHGLEPAQLERTVSLAELRQDPRFAEVVRSAQR